MKKPKHINNINPLKNFRRILRNNSTEEERILWSILRKREKGFKFRRQHSIGNFIVDFYCPALKLAIEIDGKQHADNVAYDLERTDFFGGLNIKVLRFWNSDVKNNLSEVLNTIEKELTTPSSE